MLGMQQAPDISDGQRLFELSVREGVPMSPQNWGEVHPDWQAMWERIAAGFKAGATQPAPAEAT